MTFLFVTYMTAWIVSHTIYAVFMRRTLCTCKKTFSLIKEGNVVPDLFTWIFMPFCFSKYLWKMYQHRRRCLLYQMERVYQ